ncbi:hypothetical protein Pcar_2885 [Syntrophotalea carbinolica DSM 2380]|uniref:Uncharacterized protein n=1 Tax=Syntrophotalea carbinolica (strain DSM 2380 / NBRC 103641 / GraBd1) TaxID=338963 RepID=Q3A0I7_SYNC1|nr:hypothetical protein [Syntrophotalea carbinolica]ABA90120.1 hypothetical protein Pcar_2885 [Syntrophotalea carbinolica DSM 2380]
MSPLQSLRKPLFLAAVVLLAIVLLAELGAAVAASFSGRSISVVGWGIPCLALLDGQLVFTVLLMAAPLILPERITGRVQGVATFIVSLLLLIGCVAAGVAAVGLLMLLIGLLLALPFGPIAYAAMGYASFPTGAAAATLGLLMMGKLVSSGVLVIAHQRFLENKGLILLIATSLLATIVISYLHGMVPGFLVSVTDLIGAIVVVILAAIWVIVGLVFAVIAMIKAAA